MKNYDDLSPSIKLMLEDAVLTDPYGLSPKTLYKNILGSINGSQDLQKVAEIFEVSLSLVMMIEKENS